MYVRVFDHSGRPIAQLKPRYATRSWRLNDIGEARVEIARTSPKVLEPFLRWGNLITIDSDDVPLWGGVILPPMRWTSEGVVINAYSGERLLKNRLLPKNYYAKGAPPGEVFETMIRWVRRAYHVGIDPGSIFQRGAPTKKEYHYDDAWESIIDLAKTKYRDFWIEPYFKDGWLRFRANWYRQRGSDLSGKIALIEGVNLVGPIMYNETGEIVNHCVLSGAGDSWQEMPIGEYEDEELTDLYSRWSSYGSMSDIIGAETLARHAKAKVETTKYAEGIFDVNCANVDDLWHKINVGDTVRLESHTIGWGPDSELGFRGKVKIMAQAVNEAQGYMPLALLRVRE